MMKRIMSAFLAFILFLCMALSSAPTPVFAAISTQSTEKFAGGDGTEANPYLIATKEHLNNVRYYLSSHFKMIADIVFSEDDFKEGGTFYNDGAGWLPIGTNRSNAFTGIFDGNSHKISGLEISHSGADVTYIGLFGYSNGTIKDLILTDCKISATADTATLDIGGVVGYNNRDGSVIRCSFDGTIQAQGYTGGLVGYNWGVIEECYNAGSVSSSNRVGGIAGVNYETIRNCYNFGIVSCSSYSYVGGIVGSNGGTVDLCYNMGNVRGNYKGGICGVNSDVVSSCYYLDTVSLGSGSGADAATKCSVSEMQLQQTFANFDFDFVWTIDSNSNYPFPSLKYQQHEVAEDNTTDFAGGTGDIWNPYIVTTPTHLNNVRNDLNAHYVLGGNIVFTESDFAEGGAFYNDGSGWRPIGNEKTPFSGSFDGNNHTISGISITTIIEDTLYAGLFGYNIGTIKNVNIKNCHISISANSTAQSTTYDYAYIGSLVGYGRSSTLVNCHHSGTLDIVCSSTTQKYYIYAGGLVGDGNAVNCSNSGQLTAKITSSSGKFIDVLLGGIAGRADMVTQCKNTGIISANSARYDSYLSVGGIVGGGMKIEQCSNSGPISFEGSTWCDSRIGGICGSGASGVKINQCYNSGTVDGSSDTRTGGIVGYIGGDGSVRDCFNVGHVDGGWSAGIVGDAFGTVSTYTCYNAGLVFDGYYNYRYAILGSAVEYVIVNCYTLEGMAKNRTYTTACTAEVMAKQDTYAGFDFDSVWTWDASTGYPWPTLKAVPMHNDMRDVSTSTIIFDNEQVQYHTAQPEVTVVCNGKTLELGTDYVLQFTVGETSWFALKGWHSNMEDIGAAKVRVIGIGHYFNCKDDQFEVVKYDLSNASVSVNGNHFDLQNFEYDGTEKKQSNIVLLDENFNVISNEHYDVTYKNNVDIGIATMIITAKGDYYTGTIEKQFEIYPRVIQRVIVATWPNKLIYQTGDTEIDFSGGEITVYYQDGGIEMHDMTSDMLLDGTNLYVPGVHKVWVTYEGYSAYYEITVVDITRGDVNNDGKITITDMLAVKSHILGKSTLNGNAATAGDTNKDGKITITDFIQIKAHILGKSTIEQ